jgi:hypothetical protein
MDYRTIEIHWMPHNQAQWGAFVLSRKEAARLWADLVERHHRIRRLGWRWPSKARWQQWAKGRYPGLAARLQVAVELVARVCVGDALLIHGGVAIARLEVATSAREGLVDEVRQ